MNPSSDNRSKEDILYKQEPSDDAGAFSDEQIYIAMDEWAKQQSIAFAEWVNNTYDMDSNGFYWRDYQNKIYYAIADLYPMFLTHQSQQK